MDNNLPKQVLFKLLLVLGVLIMTSGIVAKAFVNQPSNLSLAEYTEADLLRNLANKLAAINSATYNGAITLIDVLPATTIKAKLQARSTTTSSGTVNWSLNLTGGSSAGGLLSEFDLDAWRRGDAHYLRFNRLPAIFPDLTDSIEGRWLDSTKVMKDYNFANTNLTQSLAGVVQTALASDLILFERPPYQETINNRRLWRYDLALVPAAFPFFAQELPLDSGGELLGRLVNADFVLLAERYNEKADLTLWLDADGWPAMIKQTSPEFIFELNLSGINQVIELESAPVEAEPFEQVLENSI